MAGSIQIDILANTQKLVTGMNKAEKSVQKFSSNATKLIGAFATIFVTGKLVSAISKSNAELDKLAKTASKLGIASEELQILRLSAEEAGVATTTLDMAMQRVVRRIAEASQGTGEASNALKELGLNAEDLAKLSPDVQMRQLADAMSEVTNQGDKVRLSMKLFDSEGVALVNLLEKGSKVFDETGEKMRKFGLIISSEHLPAIEKANDAWAFAGKIMGSVSTGVGVVLADVFSDITDEVMRTSGGLDLFSKSMNVAKVVVFNVASGVNKAVSTISLSMKGWEGTILLVKSAIADLWGTQAESNTAYADYIKWTSEAKTQTDDWAKSMMGLDGASLFLEKWFNKKNESSAGGLGITATSGELKETISLWKQMGLASDEYYKKVSNKTTQAKAIVESMNATISSGITGAFRQAMDGAVNFGQVFENILKDIVAQLIHVLVVQQAVAAGLRSLGFSTSATTATATPAPVQGAMANGGTARTSGAYLVGERGAEIVNLSAGDNVTPNHELNKAPTVNVINNAGANVSVNERDGEIEIVLDAVANAITRGTSNIGSAMEQRYGFGKV